MRTSVHNRGPQTGTVATVNRHSSPHRTLSELRPFFAFENSIGGDLTRCEPLSSEPGYFHSHVFETVAPWASTSYSKAAHTLFRRASFFEAVLKNSMPL